MALDVTKTTRLQKAHQRSLQAQRGSALLGHSGCAEDYYIKMESLENQIDESQADRKRDLKYDCYASKEIKTEDEEEDEEKHQRADETPSSDSESEQPKLPQKVKKALEKLIWKGNPPWTVRKDNK